MDPKKVTNECLAATLELWALLNEEEFNKTQMSYFEEIVWRLRLMPDQEKENLNG